MSDSMITKKALANAIKDLMAEKPFEKISVSDICERCYMNRKSFYYHFKDKYDLVNWIFDTEFMDLLNSKEDTNIFGFLDIICDYFYNNKEFYVNAFQVNGQNSFSDHFSEMLHPILFEYIQLHLIGTDNCEFNIMFFSDAFKVSLIRWLRDNVKLTPSEYVGKIKEAMLMMTEVYNEVSDFSENSAQN